MNNSDKKIERITVLAKDLFEGEEYYAVTFVKE